jgi:hypothetical protein
MPEASIIDNRFVYHPPTPESIPKFEKIRATAREFAILLADLTPASREQSLAITNLEEVVFWANAAIARNQRPTS